MERPADLLWLHARLCEALGSAMGVANEEALVAAWDAVQKARDGDLFGRAAAIACALARHRPFRTANQPAAMLAAGVLLRDYDLDLRLEPDAMPALARLLVAGTPEALADWLRERTAPLAPEANEPPGA